MRLGQLNQRVAFDRRVPGHDNHGGQRSQWDLPANAIEASAHFLYLRGGETVQAARLEGRQPIVVTIEATDARAAIDPSWRMRDLRTGTVAPDGMGWTGREFNIKSVAPSDDGRWLELTVVYGEPA